MAKFDAYEAITAQIIAKLEAGVRPWRADWNTSDTTAAGAGFMPPLAPPRDRRTLSRHQRAVAVDHRPGTRLPWRHVDDL
jgi:hypothetical protein